MASTLAPETKAAFARRIGVSAARISQLISRGMPVLADGRVDVAAALAWLDDNLDTSKRTGGPKSILPREPARAGGASANQGINPGASRGSDRTPGAAAPASPVSPASPGRFGGGASGPGAGGSGGPSLAEAKRVHELVKVQRAKLALEREREEVVSRDAVRIAVFSWARQERDSWLAWCRRVVPLIASETGANAGTLFAALDRHVREHLNDLAEPTLDISE